MLGRHVCGLCVTHSVRGRPRDGRSRDTQSPLVPFPRTSVARKRCAPGRAGSPGQLCACVKRVQWNELLLS